MLSETVCVPPFTQACFLPGRRRISELRCLQVVATCVIVQNSTLRPAGGAEHKLRYALTKGSHYNRPFECLSYSLPQFHFRTARLIYS